MSRYTSQRERKSVRRAQQHTNRSTGRVTLPAVTNPNDAPEEIDRSMENRHGSRSRKRVPKPLRFFPHLFPVPTTLYGILTVVGAVVLIAALFYEVREVLSPILLVIAIGCLLYPFRKEPKLRPVMVAAAIVFLAWFVTVTGTILLPFILAFLFAYMAEPLVTFLSRRWYIKRWISALTLTLLSLAVATVATGYVVPVLISQVGSALGAFEGTTRNMIQWAQSGALHEITGVPQEKINTMIQTHVVPRLGEMDGWLIGWIGKVGQSVPDMLTTFINFLMVPFIMFYCIKDYWKIRGALYSFLPQEYQRRSYRLLRDMDEIMGGYLRGDIITSIFQALFIGIGLYLIGVPGAVLLGLLSGFLNLIPLIGAYIAYVFAAVAALLTPDPMMSLFWVTMLYGAEGVLETAVIGPQVFGRHTDLHALLVIISILIFGYFMGITGMLIAIPVTSLLVRFATRWRDERRVAVEREKVEADLRENPHHARKGELVPAGGTGS